jgi:hypothetical protein
MPLVCKDEPWHTQAIFESASIGEQAATAAVTAVKAFVN